MSDIPAARIRLQAIANQIRGACPGDAKQIEYIIEKFLTRAKPIRRSAKNSPAISAEGERMVRELLFQTSLSITEIAAEVGVNPGVVSRLNREANRPFDPERRMR